MTLTNAQAALQAAASAFTGRVYATEPGSVLALADQFKAWLDKQEETAPEQPRLIEYDLPERAKPFVTVWKCEIRPRNTDGKWLDAEVLASDTDGATSMITARWPGHTWRNLYNTGEAWEEVAPNQYRRAPQ